MPEERTRLDAYHHWAKQRIDEMDATLASLEAKAGKLSVESKMKADQLVADLKKRRDEFRAKAKGNAQVSGAALQKAKTQLESQWDGFEAQVKAYFKTAGKQVGQQQATFRAVATAQAKAWRETADKLRAQAANAAAVRRVDIHGAIEQMKADAAATEARLRKLRQAGSESWSSLSGALAKSRKAFDRANQAACDALKRAAA